MTVVCPVGAEKPNYKAITGRCYCGAIEWHLMGKVNFTSTCHCDDCKTISGSAYGQTALMIYDRKLLPTRAHHDLTFELQRRV